MKLPKVKEIKKQYEVRSLEEQEITRFDEVIDQRDRQDVETSHFSDDTIVSILEEAEKWDNIPREVCVIDFWRPPEVIKSYLSDLGDQEIENPGLEGLRFSQRLIDTGREMDSATQGYLVEVENKLSEDELYNPNMVGGVSRIYDFVPIPEEYQGDDIFTKRDGDGRLGLIIDDYTVLAQQGLKRAEWTDSKRGKNIPYAFRQAMEENIESYVPLGED